MTLARWSGIAGTSSSPGTYGQHPYLTGEINRPLRIRPAADLNWTVYNLQQPGIRLIKELKTSNPPLAQELTQKVDGSAALIAKVTSLRHKVFAHRDKTRSRQDVFAAVKLKPKEMETVERLAQDIISAVSGETSKKDVRRELRLCEAAVRNDAPSLMQVLVKCS